MINIQNISILKCNISFDGNKKNKIKTKNIGISQTNNPPKYPNVSFSKPLQINAEDAQSKNLAYEAKLAQIDAANISETAIEIKQTAEKIKQDINKTIQPQINSIKSAIEQNSPYIKQVNGIHYYEEYNDGRLAKRTSFAQKDNNISLYTIENFNKNGSKDIIKFAPDNSIYTVDLNCFPISENSSLTYEHIEYEKDGHLIEFAKELKQTNDGVKDINEKYTFYKDMFVSMLENYRYIPSKLHQASKRYIFSENNTLIQYTNDFKHDLEYNDWDIDKEFYYSPIDNGIKSINKNIKIRNNTLITREHYLFNSDNKIINYTPIEYIKKA